MTLPHASTTPGVVHERLLPGDAHAGREQRRRRAASKRGTYQFTYTETLNGKTTPPATVTITVN